MTKHAEEYEYNEQRFAVFLSYLRRPLGQTLLKQIVTMFYRWILSAYTCTYCFVCGLVLGAILVLFCALSTAAG